MMSTLMLMLMSMMMGLMLGQVLMLGRKTASGPLWQSEDS